MASMKDLNLSLEEEYDASMAISLAEERDLAMMGHECRFSCAQEERDLAEWLDSQPGRLTTISRMIEESSAAIRNEIDVVLECECHTDEIQTRVIEEEIEGMRRALENLQTLWRELKG